MPIINWFLTWWLSSGRYNWSRLRRQLFERHYLSTLLPTVRSLDDIKKVLSQVKWTMDGPLHLFDSISFAQTVWFKKKDDCDGFAVLAATLLNKWNPDFNPVLVTAMTHPVKNSHTVCVFNSPESNLWFFDNSTLRQGKYETYNEIVLEISKNTQKLVCWDVRNPTSLEMIEFHRE